MIPAKLPCPLIDGPVSHAAPAEGTQEGVRQNKYHVLNGTRTLIGMPAVPRRKSPVSNPKIELYSNNYNLDII
jgi:hypothetical protein